MSRAADGHLGLCTSGTSEAAVALSGRSDARGEGGAAQGLHHRRGGIRPRGELRPDLDSIVRVQAGHLRAKLREYYGGEGRNDAVWFDLPKGTYAIRIQAQRQPPVDASGENPLAASRFAPVTKEGQKEFPASTHSVGDKPSLAVLPFTNISSDPEQEYFADGITEDLITDLSKLSGLFVIARHSAFVYKGVAKRVQESAASSVCGICSKAACAARRTTYASRRS